MKKMILILAIIFANGIFMSCNDLNKELEDEVYETEVFGTGGEDGHMPDDDDDDDPTTGG